MITIRLSSLRGPVNDAEDVSVALARLGFETTVLVDADAASMNLGLREFAWTAGRADIALVFYSGRGSEAGGAGYRHPPERCGLDI